MATNKHTNNKRDNFVGGYASNLGHAAPPREEPQQPATDPASLERSSYGLGGFASSLGTFASVPAGATFAPAGYAPVGGFGNTRYATALPPAVQASIFSTPAVQGETSFTGGYSSALNSGSTFISSGAPPADFGGHAASLDSVTDRQVSAASSFVGGYAGNVGPASVQPSFDTYEAPQGSSAGPTSFVGGFTSTLDTSNVLQGSASMSGFGGHTSGLPSVNTISSGAGMSALGGHANSLASANVILSKCGLGAIGGYSNGLSSDSTSSIRPAHASDASSVVLSDEYIDATLRSKLENAKVEIDNVLSTQLTTSKLEISTVLAAQLADTKKEIDSALKEKLSLAMFEMDSVLTDKLAYAKLEMAKLSDNAPANANSGNVSGASRFLGGYLGQFEGASSSAKSAIPVAVNSNRSNTFGNNWHR